MSDITVHITGDITGDELMAITASRLLADHKVVFAGVGMPLLASAVARHRHAPHLTIVLEGGIIGTSLLPITLVLMFPYMSTWAAPRKP